jgi:nitrogen fixation/metabolism regulation signal transduction histidine kinase
MNIEFSRQIFVKSSNTEINERADMKNLIVAFRNFANAPKTIIKSM